MTIPCLITVRTQSTRLPGKCLLPFGEGNVLQHVIRRCKYFEFNPIVCTTTNSKDMDLWAFANDEDCDFYSGDPNNVMKRWEECAKYFDLWAYHTIDCDDPFFCHREVERSYSYMNDLKLHHVLPTKQCQETGLALMGHSISRNKGETRSLPETSVPYPSRMTLDYEEDYWFLRTIRRRFDHKTERRDIDNFLRQSPSLRTINLFRDIDWRTNQCLENTMARNNSTSMNSSPAGWKTL